MRTQFGGICSGNLGWLNRWKLYNPLQSFLFWEENPGRLPLWQWFRRGWYQMKIYQRSDHKRGPSSIPATSSTGTPLGPAFLWMESARPDQNRPLLLGWFQNCDVWGCFWRWGRDGRYLSGVNMKDLQWYLRQAGFCRAKENGRLHANPSLSIDLGFRHWWTGNIKAIISKVGYLNRWTEQMWLRFNVTSVKACNCPSWTTAPSYLMKK